MEGGGDFSVLASVDKMHRKKEEKGGREVAGADKEQEEVVAMLPSLSAWEKWTSLLGVLGIIVPMHLRTARWREAETAFVYARLSQPQPF